MGHQAGPSITPFVTGHAVVSSVCLSQERGGRRSSVGTAAAGRGLRWLPGCCRCSG